MAKRKRAAALLGLATGLIGVAATLLPPVLELEESLGLRSLFALRGPVGVPDDVVVVGIGRDSAEALGLPLDLTEWPRRLHAELLSTVVAAGASVVAFDVMFEQPRDPAQDEAFARAIADSRATILLDRMQRRITQSAAVASGQDVIIEDRLRPLAAFRDAAVATVPFPLPVVPVRTSQFWAFLPSAADAPTLPVAALQIHLLDLLEPFRARLVELRPALAERLPPCADTEPLRRGDALETLMREIGEIFDADAGLAGEMRERLRRDANEGVDAETRRGLEALLLAYGGPSSRYANYYGPAQSIATVPYHVAVGDHGAGLDWNGKAVFVGFSERTQPDQQDTFYSVFSQRSGLNLSGVEIAATAFANLLDGRALTPLPMSRGLLLVLVWGALVGTGLTLVPTGIAVAAGLAAGGVYAGVALHQFGSAGSWWPLVVPLLLQLPVGLFGAAWSNYAHARGRSERLGRATRRYLPESLVRRMEDDGRSASDGYELLDGVCLVTDAEQYTALSESMQPDAVAVLLNEYYEVLFGIVARHGGQVTDVVGDSMVAVWASGDARERKRAAACRAAVEIVAAQTQPFGHENLMLPTRVGLHGGELLLGTIGAQQHLEYRAVGDTVNSASRVQELNKQLGTRALVSSEALGTGDEWISRELGTFMLAGKQAALTVHELIGTATARQAAIVAPFTAALGAYRAGALGEALARFRELASQFPEDGPSRFYSSLCERAARSSSAEPWDAIVRLPGK